MKTNLSRWLFALATLSILNLSPAIAPAQGTAFTYQGRLNVGTNPATGLYDLQFGLWDSLSGGTRLGSLQTNSATAVTNGLFSVQLDFGNQFPGAPRWLEISVRTNGAATFSLLTPRQPLTPVPYAIFAEGASATGLSGTIPSANLAGGYGSVISFTNPASSFAGNGSGLTGVNAALLGGLAASNFWKTTGNSGTTPGVNFAGTTDSNAFEIHVNGSRLLRLEPDPLNAGAGNLIGGHPANTIFQPTSKGDVISGGGFGGGPNIIASNSSGVFIGAGSLNEVGPNVNDSVIAGGYSNTNQSPDSVIGGGVANWIQTNSQYSHIGGGFNNSVSGIGSFIGGGGSDGTTYLGNVIQDNAATIGGGLSNTIPAGGTYAFIGGGRQNVASIGYATISGGYLNSAVNAFTAIGGGAQNTVSGPETTIGGGFSNNVSGFGATIGGGEQNTAIGDYAVVAGGFNNAANGGAVSGYAAVVGGYGNNAAAVGSFIGGGGSDGTTSLGNYVNSKAAAIVGGVGNIIPSGAEYAFTGGGYFNTNSGKCATVGGGYLNDAVGVGSVIAGGGYTGGENLGNFAAGTAAVIGGGELNSIPAAGMYATIAGGHENYLNAARATIGGGEDNQNNGAGSVIGGGESNATLGSGTGSDQTVGGGYNNTANGTYSTVPGGQNNYADGIGSFAAGSYAGADYNGSFIWSDNTGTLTSDTAVNQFVARASGGFFFYTGTGGSGAKLAAGATSWTTISDRNAKKNFQTVDTVAVLDKLAAIPIQQWNYKWEKDTDVPNLGPMAQDFKAAFYPGRDDKSISTLEFDGVELAAIQGLNQKVEDKSRNSETRIQKLEAENAELKARLDKLEQLLAAKN
jgi:hypothetical protein